MRPRRAVSPYFARELVMLRVLPRPVTRMRPTYEEPEAPSAGTNENSGAPTGAGRFWVWFAKIPRYRGSRPAVPSGRYGLRIRFPIAGKVGSAWMMAPEPSICRKYWESRRLTRTAMLCASRHCEESFPDLKTRRKAGSPGATIAIPIQRSMALGSRIHSAARHSFRKDRHNHEAGHQSSKPDKDGLGDDDKNPLDKKLLVDGLAGTVGVRDDGQSRRYSTPRRPRTCATPFETNPA